jgi:cation:H+ antiporter
VANFTGIRTKFPDQNILTSMEFYFQTFSLSVTAGLFFAAAIFIVLGGWRLSNIADRLADRTGMGEAITGALFLGAVTSLAGIVTSVTAAWHG